MQMKITVVETGTKGKHTISHTETVSEIKTRAQALEDAATIVSKYVPELMEQATLTEVSPKERRKRERS